MMSNFNFCRKFFINVFNFRSFIKQYAIKIFIKSLILFLNKHSCELILRIYFLRSSFFDELISFEIILRDVVTSFRHFKDTFLVWFNYASNHFLQYNKYNSSHIKIKLYLLKWFLNRTFCDIYCFKIKHLFKLFRNNFGVNSNFIVVHSTLFSKIFLQIKSNQYLK